MQVCEKASRKGKYIDSYERIRIWSLRKEGRGVRDIARAMGRAPSTISRELKRGTVKQIVGSDYGLKRYEYVYSDEASAIRAKREHAKRGAKLKLIGDTDAVCEIERLIKHDNYSPAAALYEVAESGLLTTVVCVGTIYNYIHSRLMDVEPRDLPYNKTAYARKSETKKKSRMHLFWKLHGMSIEQRPPEIEDRSEFGHWEGDLIVGCDGSKSCLFTLTERVTRFEISVKIEDRHCSNVAEAIDAIEGRYGCLFGLVFKSITFDNGSEFLKHELLTRSKERGEPRFRIFYAHPYSSYERGSNENANRMIRRKFPKGTNFDEVSEEAVADAIAWVNNYPRRVRNGKAKRARILFAEQMAAIAKAS